MHKTEENIGTCRSPSRKLEMIMNISPKDWHNKQQGNNRELQTQKINKRQHGTEALTKRL